MEHASPERPVGSESPSWNRVYFAKAEKNRNTANTGFLPEEAPNFPTASTDTTLPEYAAGQGINRGTFNLIIRVNERVSLGVDLEGLKLPTEAQQTDLDNVNEK